MNSRVTKKERGLIKGALRRVFSRSDLRKAAVDATRITHSDPDRPRVTKWSRCPMCNGTTPTYLMEVDHQTPVVALDSSLDEMDANTLVDRIWCVPSNLLALCPQCHKLKSKAENAQRRANKKGKKQNVRKSR